MTDADIPALLYRLFLNDWLSAGRYANVALPPEFWRSNHLCTVTNSASATLDVVIVNNFSAFEPLLPPLITGIPVFNAVDIARRRYPRAANEVGASMLLCPRACTCYHSRCCFGRPIIESPLPGSTIDFAGRT